MLSTVRSKLFHAVLLAGFLTHGIVPVQAAANQASSTDGRPAALTGPVLSPLMLPYAWNALGSGLNDTVYAIVTNGTDVYAGGQFTDAGGDPNADYIAKWDGTSWSALGTGLNGQVNTIAVFAGSIYVGGTFTDAGGDSNIDYIARWDGSTWSMVGNGFNGVTSSVNVIGVDGSNFYIAGSFQDAGGVSAADYIAKLDGGTWESLGPTPVNGPISSIVVAGATVYAGGEFIDAGGDSNADYIAQWDGASWSAMGSGFNSVVSALALEGGNLYAGGLFTDAGGNTSADRIAKWNGSSWLPLGSGLSSYVNALVVDGSNLYVAGNFLDAGSNSNADYIAKWDGTAWSALTSTPLNATAAALAIDGLNLYVGGSFLDAGGNNGDKIVRFEMTNTPLVTAFAALSPSPSLDIPITLLTALDNQSVSAYMVTDSATPPSAEDAAWTTIFPTVYTVGSDGTHTLYPWAKDAVGNVSSVYGSPLNVTVDTTPPSISTTAWNPLGNGLSNTVYDLALSGNDVYVTGSFLDAGSYLNGDRIAKWNGTSWSPLGSGLNAQSLDVTVDGSTVYAGGHFTAAGGITGANFIAQWNGSSWSTVGNSLGGNVDIIIASGSDLYVGGGFGSAGGSTSAANLARLNGGAWQPMGATPFNNSVYTIAIDGSDVYVGGSFQNAGGNASADAIAKWNGSSWSALNTGVNNTVYSIVQANGQFYVGGSFTDAGGVVNADYIAIWNGTSWSVLGSGLNGTVNAIAVSGGNVYVGGLFTNAGGDPNADYIAKWNGSSWSAVGNSPLNGFVETLVINGPYLYAGGGFTDAGGNPNADRIAMFVIDSAVPTVTSFTVPSTSNNLNIPITEFTATDDSSISGYLITESDTQPSAGAAGWAGSAPSTYTVGSEGVYTLYPWVKDSIGNVSAAYGSPASVTVDNSAPVVNSFTVISPSNSLNIPIATFTAADDVGVAAYLITQSNTPPAYDDAGWTASAPTTYTVAGEGSYTLHPWAKDAAGNVSAVYGSPANVTVDTTANTWNALGSGLNSNVFAIAVDGTDIYVGGQFIDVAGNSNADSIAKRDGTSWSALGTGLNGTVRSIVINGSDIYVGGDFTDAGGDPNADRVAKWDGTSWSALGTGLNGTVHVIAVSGSNVYVGGSFTDASGNLDADYIAKLDGDTWGGIGPTPLNGAVYSVFANGGQVYAGGSFQNAGGDANADNIAFWNGTSWSALGSGLNNSVYTVVWQSGDVYAGGQFTDAGGNTNADYIAKWDGASWFDVGGGLSSNVRTIAINGTDIYVGGFFLNAGGDANADRIAKWDGTSWSALGTTPLNGAVYRIAINGLDLYAGGQFTDAGGSASADYIARFEIDADAPTIDSFSATSPSNSLDTPITAFTASDNVAVTGYKITESSTPPSAGAAGWTASTPTTYTVAGDGNYTLYPWAKDATGNVSAVYGSPANVTVDATAPTVTGVTSNGNTGCLLNSGTYYCNASDAVNVRVAFSEAVNVTGMPQLALNSGGTASYSSGSGTSTLTFTYTVASGQNASDLDYNGANALTLNGGTIQDAGTNDAILTLPVPGASGSLSANTNIVVDTTVPTVVSSVRANTDPTNAASVDFTVSFSETVTGVDTADFTLIMTEVSGASIIEVGGSGATRTVSVNTGSGNGSLRLDVLDNDTITDLAGNTQSGDFTGGESYTIDKTAPTVVSSLRANTNPTTAASVDFTVTFSESVTGVDVYNFSLNTSGGSDAYVTGVSGSDATYTVSVTTGSASATLRLDVIDDDPLTDLAGNALSGDFTGGESYTFDISTPSVVSSVRANTNPTNATSVDFTVTFSDDVTGVDANGSDFTLTTSGVSGAAITGVTPVSASVYTVSVNTGSGNGTIRLDVLDDDSIIDASSQPLGGAGNGNGAFTNGEEYSIIKSAVKPGVPALLTPASSALVGSTQPLLDWKEPLPAAHHYQIQIAANNTFTSLVVDESNVTTSDFTPAAALIPGKLYYWRVRALNVVNVASGWSTARSFKTPLAQPTLGSPIAGISLVKDRPAFGWTSVDGAAQYTLQVSTVSTFSTLLVNVNVNTNEYDMTKDLPQNKTLYWRVRAKTSAVTGPWSVKETFKTGNPPTVPALVAPVNNALIKDYTPVLNWNNSSVPAGTTFQHYLLEVDNDSNFSSPEVTATPTLSEFTPVSDLVPNTKYYWRVSTVNIVNDVEHFSAWAPVWSFRTVIPAPQALAMIPTGDPLKPSFEWDDATGPISGYTIQVSTSATFSTFIVNSTTVNSTYNMMKNLPSGKTIYWRVRVNGANGPSAWSTSQFSIP